MVVCCAGTVLAAGTAANAFTKSWSGRKVVVRGALYSVLYDEVGRTGLHYHDKLAGLTVATTDGEYYEFDAPGSDNDIAEPTAARVMKQMSERFNRANYLDIGTLKTITPLLLQQYDRGATLIVDSVKVERTRVRFEFRQPEDADNRFATSLTVEWPVPLSKTFSERGVVESIMRRYVDPL